VVRRGALGVNGQLNRPRLDLSHDRIRDHQRDAYEHVFTMMIYCLKRGDYETALWLKKHLRKVEDNA
jgi:hypothetical protein